MRDRFPTVQSFFSTYLNQDFDLIFGTADDAVRKFVEHSERAKVSLAADEIQAIIDMKLGEDDLRKLIFDDLGSYYYYPSDWVSGDLWLGHVLRLMAE